MKWSHTVEWASSSLPEDVWPPERWPQWMPGIRVVSRSNSEVALQVEGPVPHHALVDTEHSSTELSVQQLEGRARHVGLTLRLQDGTLWAELEVDSTQSIPGSLRRELQSLWLQEALARLTQGQDAESALDSDTSG